MSYAASESEHLVILDPASTATATVIWLHGLGADGYDFVPIVEELRLPQTLATRFVFPHARARPVTINNGFVMRAWYDIKGLNRSGPEDETGIRESEHVVRDLIAHEVERGIPTNRIVIAGFSQGGAIALQTALRYPEPLAGVMALSTYLPLRESLAGESAAANRSTPILMCHGSQDGVVPIQLGELSRDVLTELGHTVEWRVYPMQHSVCMEEVNDISHWLQARLSAT